MKFLASTASVAALSALLSSATIADEIELVSSAQNIFERRGAPEPGDVRGGGQPQPGDDRGGRNMEQVVG